jgi:hypothetical protein
MLSKKRELEGNFNDGTASHGAQLETARDLLRHGVLTIMEPQLSLSALCAQLGPPFPSRGWGAGRAHCNLNWRWKSGGQWH